MKAIDFIECGDCQTNIENFISKGDYSEQEQEIIAQFALFLEMKKLREFKIKTENPAVSVRPSHVLHQMDAGHRMTSLNPEIKC